MNLSTQQTPQEVSQTKFSSKCYLFSIVFITALLASPTLLAQDADSTPVTGHPEASSGTTDTNSTDQTEGTTSAPTTPAGEEVVAEPVVTKSNDVVTVTESVVAADNPNGQEGEVVIVDDVEPVEEVVVAAKAAPEVMEKKWYDYISINPWLAARLTVGIKDKGEMSPSINSSGVNIEANFGPFKLFIAPELRQTKNREFFPSNIVLKQAYIQWNTPVEALSIAGGLIYNRFGLFWDDSFFGNNSVYFGHKLNADYNLQFAWDSKPTDSIDLKAWLQLSPGTDGIDLSLPVFYPKSMKAPGDFELDKAYKSLFATRLRILPKFIFGDFALQPGLSLDYSYYKAPTSGNAQAQKDVNGNLLATAVDLSLFWKDIRFTTEFAGQFIDAALSYFGKERVTRFHISNSLHAPVFDAPEREWFSQVALNLGYSYSIFKTENFKDVFLYAGAVTQIYDHLSFLVEYGRFWNTAEEMPYIDQIEFIFNVNF